MKLTFAQFERARVILEHATPEDVNDAILLEHGITRDALVKINEGFLGDILGSLVGKLKEKILKAIPGSILKKADEILAEYKKTKIDIFEKTRKERDKIYKARLEGPEETRNKEQIVRSEKAIEAIEAASKSKLNAIDSKLKLLTKDKSDIVKNYISMQLYQIQEDVANKQLKDAEENADEESLAKIEDEVKEAKRKREEAAKAIEEAEIKKKADIEKADKEKAAREEEEANNPLNAKKGQVWLYKKDEQSVGQEVTIVAPFKDPNVENGKIQVKGLHTPFPADPKKLVKLLKNPK